MLYLRFSFPPCFQVLLLYLAWRQGMLIIHQTGVLDEHPLIPSPEIFLFPLCLFHFKQKRSLGAQMVLSVHSQSPHSPKGHSFFWPVLEFWIMCDYGIRTNCAHPQPITAWMQPARTDIFISLLFFPFLFPCTPHLFIWLPLTQLQLLQFNLFPHKWPGADTLISRGCFQRFPGALSPGNI